MYFLANYMLPVNNRGFDGFRAQPEFTTGKLNIQSNNPSRPSDYVLSKIYTHEEVPGFSQAIMAADAKNEFPGRHDQ